MICIYCRNIRDSSVSHVIPESLGQGPELIDGVCAECNHSFNSEVEQSVRDKLLLIRNFLSLSGKHRSSRPAIHVEAKFCDNTYRFKVRDPRDLESRLFVFNLPTDSEGRHRRLGLISSSSETLNKAKQHYEERHPGTTWDEIPQAELDGQLTYCSYFDVGFLANLKALRLAAKIGFEWWCMERSPSHVLHEAFDPIRRFVRYGEVPSSQIVSIVVDDDILGNQSNIPFGIHSILIALHPSNRNLVVIVGLFSFIFYKVILTRRYPVIAQRNDLTLIHPQTGCVYEPKIQKSLHPSPNFSAQRPSDSLDPMSAIRRIEEHLLDRLNTGLRCYEPNSKNGNE